MNDMRLLWIALASFVAAIFWQCTRPAAVSNATTTTVLYPNQDSELALLMREMDKDANAIRQAIMEGRAYTDIREKFARIHTATPTEGEKKSPAFDAMATQFLKSVDALYGEGNDRISQFNLVVNNCLNCHKMQCPGPTVRIKKLLIE